VHHAIAIEYDLPINAGVAHFFLEFCHCLRIDDWVGCAL
jgi:hypothetical protein